MIKRRTYTNGEITIYWDPSKCVHATYCFRNLRSVFDPVKRPWINPEGATTAEIIEVIEKCPSSALSFSWNDPEKNKMETSHKLFRDKT